MDKLTVEEANLLFEAGVTLLVKFELGAIVIPIAKGLNTTPSQILDNSVGWGGGFVEFYLPEAKDCDC